MENLETKENIEIKENLETKENIENNENLVEVIKDILAKTIEAEDLKQSWTEETNIIDDIGIDSLQIVRFMMAVEDRLGISINYEEMTFDDFSSIKALKEFLLKNL